MYIEMYVCRNKGSEDINPSTNSAYIQVVASKLNVPFFFTLFTWRVHPIYNRAETISCLHLEIRTLVSSASSPGWWPGAGAPAPGRRDEAEVSPPQQTRES